MQRCFAVLYYLLCGLIVSLLVNMLMSLSVWLEMRVHERYVLFGVMVVVCFMSLFYKKINLYIFIFLELLLVMMVLWLGKEELLYYVLRESLNLSVNIQTIKIFFLATVALVNLYIFIFYFKKGKI